MSTYGGGSERFLLARGLLLARRLHRTHKAGHDRRASLDHRGRRLKNWGVNTANIVFYIGDANPYVFAEMYPGAAPAQYNTSAGASVLAPILRSLAQFGSQIYDVPYAGSWGAPYPTPTGCNGSRCTPATCSKDAAASSPG